MKTTTTKTFMSTGLLFQVKTVKLSKQGKKET